MKRKPKTAKPQPRTAPADVQLWQATLSLEWRYHGTPFGVLVTDPGEPSRPIAFLFDADDNQPDYRAAALIENAERVLREPWAITSGAFNAVDLRDAGRLNARTAVPPWMYGLLLRPIVDGKPVENVPAVEFRPFCPFMWERMRSAAAAGAA